MKNDFRIAINQICNERQLSKEVVIEAIEAALVSAYKKNFGANQNITVKIDPDTGKARVFAIKEIVDKVKDPRTQIALADAQKIDAMAQLGGMLEQEMTPRNFGRIAAQTAKQVILQRIREAERDAVYSQFADRESEIINGTVRNIDEHGNVVLALGKAEAVLQPSEQIPTESYRPGQRLRSYVVEVQKTSRGPQIMVSRTHRQFLRRLLELEVPEIFNGTVEIKAIAREPGSRSKVAVAAMQEGIDPVGSCVGVRGVRIQNVVNELSGEKIDVVAWSPDPGTFVANALSPAKVDHVEIDEASKTAIVVVPDKQLSLAIGKEGQNARLAARLTGWRIDIKSSSEAEIEAARKAAEAAEAAAREAERNAAREKARKLLEEAEALMRAEEEREAAAALSPKMPVAEVPVSEVVAETEAPETTTAAEATREVTEELIGAVEEEILPADQLAMPVVETATPEPLPADADIAVSEETWREDEELPEEDYADRKRKIKSQRRRQRDATYEDELDETAFVRRRKPNRRGSSWD